MCCRDTQMVWHQSLSRRLSKRMPVFSRSTVAGLEEGSCLLSSGMEQQTIRYSIEKSKMKEPFYQWVGAQTFCIGFKAVRGDSCSVCSCAMPNYSSNILQWDFASFLLIVLTQVEETTREREERLKGWSSFLEVDNEAQQTNNNTSTTPAEGSTAKQPTELSSTTEPQPSQEEEADSTDSSLAGSEDEEA